MLNDTFMLEDTFIEMEQAAKALDLQDINLAAICLRKGMEGHVEMAPPGPTPPPAAVGPMAELSKSINALEIKDFSLAALCCEKAADKLQGHLPVEVNASLIATARAIRGQDFSTAASQLRSIIRHYRPEATIPAPAEAPNVGQILFDRNSMEPAPEVGAIDRPIGALEGQSTLLAQPTAGIGQPVGGPDDDLDDLNSETLEGRPAGLETVVEAPISHGPRQVMPRF